MILLKKLDVYGQVILIIAAFVNAFLQNGETILYSYFIVGGWQVASTTIQACLAGNQLQLVERKAYILFLVLAVVTFPFGGAYILLFISPLAAIWYFSISYRELKIWQHRRFIQLR